MGFILKGLILWISIFGYTTYLKKYVKTAFTPILVLSSIGVLMFAAGLLNIMVATVYVIACGGLVCLAVCKPWKKAFFVHNKDILFLFGIFSAICVLFLIRLYGQIPTHYDCFSHWLTVIREMLNNDRMPNFSSELIIFQGYPTGSAGFVYFVCKFLGNSRDDLIVFTQSILYAASLCVFFAFVKKKKDVFSIIVIMIGSLFCIIANSSQNAAIDDLLVDTLISLISVAIVAIVIYYKDDLMRGVVASLPLQIFLVAVKNSGILMVAINTALIVILTIMQDYSAKRKWSFFNIAKFGAITAGIPAAFYYIWIQHVRYAFPNGTYSKHTASLGNYAHNLFSKTPEQIEEILITFLKRFISWNGTWLLLILVTVILVFGFFIKKYILKKKAAAEWLVLLGVFAAYFAFMFVLAVMYILSMPYDESIVLASYDRYENTVMVYIIGIITIYVLSLLSMLSNSAKDVIIRSAVTLVFALCLLNQSENIQKTLVKADTYTNSSRYDYEQIIDEYDIVKGKSYFIYGSRLKYEEGYNYFLTRYLFWSKDIKLCSSDNLDANKSDISQYDYLIIIDYDENINEFLIQENIETDKKAYEIKEVFK